MLKNLPIMWKVQVQSLGWEDTHLREGNGYLLQCSCLENSMDRGVWWATAHGVAESQTLRPYKVWSQIKNNTISAIVYELHKARVNRPHHLMGGAVSTYSLLYYV